jgi:serine-type D-Ala-D-Ala carboxypeptidase/endopeptidase
MTADGEMQAGVSVLVSADGITGNQQNGGIEIPMALANDILLIIQGITPPADKSVYPGVAGRRRRRTAIR